MKLRSILLPVILLSAACLPLLTSAQTDGSVSLRATLLDYPGNGDDHWTVAWVETDGGAFIKTLWRQGPSIGSSSWNSHCREWYNSRSGSTAFDGYSGATARNYSRPNNPVVLTWDCRDAADNLVADGDYRFWIQYAEDNGQGPFTTGGLLWTKGPADASHTYPNQGIYYASMRVIWQAIPPPPEPPVITSPVLPPAATVGVAYHVVCTATGTAPISFSASGLPLGLDMAPGGAITGIPTAAGSFAGSITAANGTLPNATQAFSITVTSIPADVVGFRTVGNHLVVAGDGPPNGVYSVVASTNLDAAVEQWMVVGTNTFDGSGGFSTTNAPDPDLPQQFYRLRVP